ncbi:glucosaminidase domain-containing protein [Christensenellaceae bacterium OttesenSCG-928-K19]|nr:glucosaminidase domain-containing protein [Christensenellaceae bacterium OttesenSCG-928-K19]
MKNRKIYLVLGVILCLFLVPAAAQAADDLSQPSGLTAAEYEEIMPEALKGYGGQIYDAEQKYDINGIFLLAVIRLESGNGESGLTKSKNNVAGNKGNSGYMSFETLSDGIEYAAQNLGENYIAEDGKYYRGGAIGDIERIYCPGGGWASQVKSLMAEYDI